MNRCEDYPCCGHTDGLGCDWTYTPEARAYDMAHVMCDHEAGFCDAYDEDDGECDGDCSSGDANRGSDGVWRCAYCDEPVDEPDGADHEQWETTTPPEVYWTDEDYDFADESSFR